MHPTIRRARDLLERLDQQEAEHQVWRAEHAAELEDARINALLAKPAAIKQRRFDDDLIYKVVVNERAPTQASTAMSPDLERQWNAWADSRIRAAVEETARVIGEEVGIAERELRREYDGRINELSSIVSALRAELATRKRKKPDAA